MLASANDVIGYSIETTDGPVGTVADFYFDDEHWTIRYLVADTGGWLTGRKVLISPAALDKIDRDTKRLSVNLSKEKVENSPDIATDQPVSRQHEADYHDYYGYPYYWTGPYLWGPVAYPPLPARSAPHDQESGTVRKEVQAARERSQDVHLRSLAEVTGYYIEAADGDIGHVEDFLLEDGSWTIRYVVVDTRNWWPGRKVLVSPQWIRWVSWSNGRVYVYVTRDRVQNAPEYDPSLLPDREYETRLHSHYGQPNYWER